MIVTHDGLVSLLGESYFILVDLDYNYFQRLKVNSFQYEITPSDLQEIFEILAEETRKC